MSASQNASSSATAGQVNSMSPADKLAADQEHEALSSYLLLVCGVLSIVLLAWRISSQVTRLFRTIACLNDDKQRYFTIADWKASFFKKHLLYAPLFRKRHNREFQLSSAINVGTLPTRLEFLILAGYLTTNLVFCVYGIPFGSSFATAAGQFGNRTGTLAVVNMVRLPSRLTLCKTKFHFHPPV